MNTRILKKKEYYKLVNTELEKVSKNLPKESKVIVVEHDDEVVGSWALIPYYHLECMHVRVDHRGKGKVARKLLSFMFKLVDSLGISSVITSSVDEVVEKMIIKLGGVELPGKHFALGIRKDF